MPPGSDKWIRSVRDNPAGKVVADPDGGNRWQWQSDDETALQLKKLNNDELAIEQTDIRPKPVAKKGAAAAPKPALEIASTKPLRKNRDAGGGFNPYDNTGKSRR